MLAMPERVCNYVIASTQALCAFFISALHIEQRYTSTHTISALAPLSLPVVDVDDCI